jgi:hypothetical protein
MTHGCLWFPKFWCTLQHVSLGYSFRMYTLTLLLSLPLPITLTLKLLMPACETLLTWISATRICYCWSLLPFLVLRIRGWHTSPGAAASVR